MKKILTLMLAAVMAFAAFAGCAKEDGTKSDSEYVKEKGTLIVGITEFKPMDYRDENGNWIGFDADLASAFAKSLGVKAEFVIIEWGSKIMELNGKNIDCVWNGMTLNDEVLNGMETSRAYCKNAQVVVVPRDKANAYQSIEEMANLKFAVESGSAGEEELKALGYEYVGLTAQADALTEVKAGTSDACVIDLLMAGAMIGEGTSYEDLTYTLSLNSEEYGVGFRKGSDLAQMLNQFFVDSYNDGSLMDKAKEYGVQESLIEQK